MNNYTMTNEDVKLIEKLIEIRNHGFYASGEEVTEVYNRVLNKHVTPTNCGSCLRQRVGELEQALNHFKSKIASESVSEPQVEDAEIMKDRMAKVRAAKRTRSKLNTK